MRDLRDFTPSNDSPCIIDGPVTFSQPIRDDIVIVDDGGLGDLHIRSDVAEEGTSRNKLIAGLAVAVLVGIGGAYGVSTYMAAQPVVADSKLPQPSAPSQTVAMTPPPAAPAPEAAQAPAVPDVVKPAPVARQAASTNVPQLTPTPNQAANTVPDPVSPAPPIDAVAGNPALNQQSAEPAPVDAAPAPEAAPAAPADPAPDSPAQ